MPQKVYLDDNGEPISAFANVQGGSSSSAGKVYLDDNGEPLPSKIAKRPSLADMLLMDNPALPPVARAGQSLSRYTKDNPVAAGAMAGGMLVAPMTGGASIPAAMAISGLGAAGGAGAGIIGRQLTTGRAENAADTLATMAAEGVGGAAGEGVGRAATGALKLAGRALYRAGALPINKLGKYGDLITEGLENRVPISKSGLAKAERLKATKIATKKAAIAEADQAASFRAKGITADAGGPLALDAETARDAVQGDPRELYDAALQQFETRHASGLTPSKLEGVKSTLDNTLGGTYKKLRMREAITPQERINLELSQAASRAQESVVPGYKAMNKEVMNAEGLRQMIDRRVSPGNSGGNQGLENAMMIAGGPMAIPARLAMLPPVISRGGILANEASKATKKVAPPFLKALMAQLAAGSPDTPEY